mmetsp:Transcript_17750/g.26243  ORF Transcript_17750/g.26243 Transcript_17750/m.26243 type:complete len:206 (-) Transcript_17750:2879-3496(-)
MSVVKTKYTTIYNRCHISSSLKAVMSVTSLSLMTTTLMSVKNKDFRLHYLVVLTNTQVRFYVDYSSNSSSHSVPETTALVHFETISFDTPDATFDSIASTAKFLKGESPVRDKPSKTSCALRARSPSAPTPSLEVGDGTTNFLIKSAMPSGTEESMVSPGFPGEPSDVILENMATSFDVEAENGFSCVASSYNSTPNAQKSTASL